MTRRLYYYPGNASFAPHLLLEEAECEFELVLVDRERNAQQSAEYLRLNPNGQIPTFVDGELVLFEAAAICLHIADHQPEAQLAPPLGSADRSRFYKWLFFLSNTVQPAYMAFRYAERCFQISPTSAELENLRAGAAERCAAAFAVIEQSFGPGPFLLGDRYSACDAYLYMLAWWAKKLPRSPLERPRVRACARAVAARPATIRASRAEGLDVPLADLD